jgi:hypothetical protein
MGWFYKNPIKDGYYWLCLYPYNNNKRKIHLVKAHLMKNENESVYEILVECNDWESSIFVSQIPTDRCWDGPLCPLPIPNRP